MRVHWFQHVPFEGLGSIAPWMARNGHTLTATRFWRGELPPAVTDYDWLIVMGGPMNIYEHDAFPWLVAEKQAIRAALDAGKRVLGICLGAQLMADVLGGPVTRNAHPEIGWFPIQRTAQASALVADWPASFEAFHWHGDTFVLPPGAVHLVQSEGCVQQAFAHGPRVLGLQFHLEIEQADVEAWITQPDGVPPPARYVQTAAQMLAQPQRFPALNALMARTLARMATG